MFLIMWMASVHLYANPNNYSKMIKIKCCYIDCLRAIKISATLHDSLKKKSCRCTHLVITGEQQDSVAQHASQLLPTSGTSCRRWRAGSLFFFHAALQTPTFNPSFSLSVQGGVGPQTHRRTDGTSKYAKETDEASRVQRIRHYTVYSFLYVLAVMLCFIVALPCTQTRILSGVSSVSLSHAG